MSPAKKTNQILRLLFILCFFLNVNYSFGEVNPELIQKKSAFILDVAQNISYKESNNKKTYKIAVFGKSTEAKSIIKDLEKKTVGLKIDGKDIEIMLFKRIRNVKPIDLIYLTGDSKIRLSDLSKKLNGNQYSLITENYPFGTSALNFAVNENNEIIYEIQTAQLKNKGAKIKSKILKSRNRISSSSQWKRKLESAMLMLKDQEEQLSQNNETISKNNEQLDQNSTTINSQNDLLIANSKLIKQQRNKIIISVVSLIIIGSLLFLVFKTNQQKKKALIQTEKAKKEILDSINYAKNIQDAMLPKMAIFNDYLKKGFILYKPKDIISGDFYWIEKKNNKIFFSIADCTGHGVPGAMMSLICSHALTKSLLEFDIESPAKILDQTVTILKNSFLKGGLTMYDGMDLALCCIDLNKKTLTYSGANSPFFYFKNDDLKIIQPNKQPIGDFDDRVPFIEHTLNLSEIDQLYIFSDGYCDQFGGDKNKKYSKKKFKELLKEIHKQSQESQKQELEKSIKDWQGNFEQIDDISIMGIDTKSMI